MKKTEWNWNEFLNYETFTPEDIEEASNRSGSWVTCACGCLCDAIPRSISNIPLDDELESLGYAFDYAVTAMGIWWGHDDVTFENHRKGAITLLQAIEERSSTILNEIPRKAEIIELLLNHHLINKTDLLFVGESKSYNRRYLDEMFSIDQLESYLLALN